MRLRYGPFMSELRGKILATIATKSGTAHAFQLFGGGVKVGDVLGIYGENYAMPVGEVTVTDIRYKGKSLDEIGNRTSGQHEHLSSLFLESGSLAIIPGLNVGPNAREQALKYGLTEDDLLA